MAAVAAALSSEDHQKHRAKVNKSNVRVAVDNSDAWDENRCADEELSLIHI